MKFSLWGGFIGSIVGHLAALTIYHCTTTLGLLISLALLLLAVIRDVYVVVRNHDERKVK